MHLPHLYSDSWYSSSDLVCHKPLCEMQAPIYCFSWSPTRVCLKTHIKDFRAQTRKRGAGVDRKLWSPQTVCGEEAPARPGSWKAFTFPTLYLAMNLGPTLPSSQVGSSLLLDALSPSCLKFALPLTGEHEQPLQDGLPSNDCHINRSYCKWHWRWLLGLGYIEKWLWCTRAPSILPWKPGAISKDRPEPRSGHFRWERGLVCCHTFRSWSAWWWCWEKNIYICLYCVMFSEKSLVTLLGPLVTSSDI